MSQMQPNTTNDAQPPIAARVDPQVKKDDPVWLWMRYYYYKWMETCENQRWIFEGREPKNPHALMPFIPFGSVPALPYHYLLTTFIERHIVMLADHLDQPMGNAGHMATFILDKKIDVQQHPTMVVPYILIEEVLGGIVTNYRLYRNKTWDFVKNDLNTLHIPEPIYCKSATWAFLSRIFDLHKQWLIDRYSATYFVDFFHTLLDGIRTGEASITPKPLLLANLENIWKSSFAFEASSEDERQREIALFWDTLRHYSQYFPNILIEGRGGMIPINFGNRFTIIVSEAAFLAFLDGLKYCSTLAEATSFLIDFVGRSIESDWLQIKGARWLSWLVAWKLRRRIIALSKKVKVLVEILANPFRLLFVVGQKAMYITFYNGLPKNILYFNQIQTKDDKGLSKPIEEIWKKFCHDQKEFVHLVVRLASEDRYSGKFPQDGEIEDKIEYYPKNDFVRFIMRQGIFKLFLNIMVPFMSE